MTENEVAKQVMDAAFLIYRTLGPGLLINFGENLLKNGFKRVVNGLEE